MFIFSLIFRYLVALSRGNVSTPTWLAPVALCVVLSGCSATRLGYDFLPGWSQWQIDGWLSIDDEQRAIVSRHLDEVHAWHRRTQLPAYIEMLRQFEDELNALDPAVPIDAVRVARWRVRITDLWTPLAERLAPGLAELAVTLRPEQIERLRRRLAESDVKWRERFLPDRARDREQARGDRIIKRAEFFLGRLDRAQERELRALAAALPASEEVWFAERQQRNRALLAFFETMARDRPPPPEAQRRAREWLLAFWLPRDPRRARQLDEAVAASDQLSAQMFARATPAQRAHLLKTARGYSQDFVALSGATAAAR